jgi:hypothetical protein
MPSSDSPVSAQETAGITIEVEAGLDGLCRRDSWVPVNVLVQNQGPPVEGQLELQLEPATTSLVYAQELALPENSRKSVRMAAFADAFAPGAIVRFRAGNLVLAEAYRITPRPSCASPKSTRPWAGFFSPAWIVLYFLNGPSNWSQWTPSSLPITT